MGKFRKTARNFFRRSACFPMPLPHLPEKYHELQESAAASASKPF